MIPTLFAGTWRLLKDYWWLALVILIGSAFAILLADRAATRADLLETRAKLTAARTDIERLETDIAAKERAAIERSDDATAVDQLREDLTDAIKSIPPGAAPGPATIALGCERLRRAGTGAADLPAVCRPQGGK